MNPKAFWSLLVFIGALILSTNALAKPSGSTCMKAVSQDVLGTTVVFGRDCDLSAALRAFPQIDPNTKQPYPPQIQKRSIYAVNQERVEDGNSYPRSILRNCVKPGRPDSHADADELANCPNGLMHYYAVAGAKVLIPIDRELSAGEKKMASAASEAEKSQALEDQSKQRQVEVAALEKAKRELDERARSLEAALAQSYARAKELEPEAEKGYWFLPLIFFGFAGMLWGTGGTVGTVLARRRFKPVKVFGRKYLDPCAAVDSMREQNLVLMAELDQWRKKDKLDAESRQADKAEFTTKLRDVENLRATSAMLAERLQNDVYDYLEEIRRLKHTNEMIGAQAKGLRIMSKEANEEIDSLKGVRSRQVTRIEQLEREVEASKRNILELEAALKAASPEERFVAILEEKDRIKLECIERNQYLEKFFELSHQQNIPLGSEKLPLCERAGLALDALNRSLCLAFANSPANSTVPPPPTSGFVLASASPSRLELNLEVFQSELARCPSLLVVDSVKACMREWAIRSAQEGELSYRLNTVSEIHDLNAFVRSSTLLGTDPDLEALVGNVDISQIYLVSDWAFTGPLIGLSPSAVPLASG